MTTNIEFDAVSNSWDEHSSAAENHNSTGVQVAQATTGQAASEPVPVDVGSGAPTQGAANAPAANQPAADANAPASNAPASNAVQGNAPAANAPATNAAAANVPHEYHAEAGNVVKLPANVSIDNIKVDGHNLVLVQPDGSEIVIKDGALNVPTFILGDVEVPRVALIAALETSHVDVAFGADGSISAGGNGAPGSAGGNFSVPPGGIGDGFGLTALLPPTALQFGQPEHRELFPGLVDRGISVVAVSLLSPTEAASETGLNGGPQQSPGSDAPSDAETSSNGTITIDAPDGIGSIVINGVAVTTVGQQIQGQFGYITIVSLNTSTGVVEYNYTVTESVTHPVHTDGYDQNDTIPDNFSITVTDSDGDTASTTFAVAIIDDVPTAVADTDSVAAGQLGPATGNVLLGGTDAGDSNTTDGVKDVQGADGAKVVGVAKGTTNADLDDASTLDVQVQGAYGKLTLHADGTYTYVRDANTPGGVNDVFTYTIKDGDGDTSHTTLTISIGNSTPEISDLTPEANGGDVVVNEDDLLAGRGPGESAGSDPSKESTTQGGTFTIHSPDGIASLNIGGHDFITNGQFTGGSFTTALGNTLEVTAYNAATGEVTYTYTLVDNEEHSAIQGTNSLFENFDVTLTDLDGQSANSTLSVNIVDDVPTAHADTNSVSEGSQVSGNVLTDGTADVLGADGAAPGGAVTGVATGSNVSNPVSGNLGGAGIVGQYGTLVLNANGSYTYTANPNAVTANAVDHFVYTITDGDGDTSTVTLDITVNNVTVTASDTDALVYEKGLPAGSDAAGNSEIFNGAITPAGGTGPYTYTLNSSATGSYGNLVLNADGTYTYTLTKTYDGATANNGITTEQDKDSFTYTVTDAHGNTTTGTILVDIVDDVPAYTLVNDGNHDGIVSLSVLNPAATTTYTGQFAEWQYGADGFGSISATGQNVQVASSSSSQIVLNLMDGSDVAAVLTLNADGTDSLQVLHRAGDVVFTPIAATSATAGGPTGSLIVDLGAATDFNILVTGDDGVAPTGQSGDLVNTSNQGWAVKGSSGQTNDPGESIKFAFVNDSNNTTPHSVDDFKFTTEGYTGGMSTAKITVLVYTDATHYDQVTLNVTSGQVIQISQLNWSAVAGTANYVVGDDIYAVKVLSDASNSGGFRLNGVEVGSQSEAPPSDLDFNGINVSITDGDGDVSTQTFNVHIDGTAGSQLTVESIAGTSGDDNLLGTGGNDTLVGGAGNDFLDGAAGNDILIGGLGFNHLTGGSGNDTFVIDPSKLSVHVADVIADYTPGQDVIDLSDLLKSLGAGAPTTDAQAGSSIDVTFSGGAAHVMVDNNGTAAGGSMVEVASLTGVASGSVISILYDHNQPTHTETVT
ncbi:Ig-like domain-containing protein [Mesorhizobium sp. M2A.F.Ca.ET.067.02.1.1]|uniref:beta strand repeat-containing protein n=2 Tax=unclassified Mesorhizobium TaxID=325217 RepID=UPI000FD5B5A5|nr:Ig-like domain-containing protein [Mesorhizobium sp. M2A.F.Ca.ET.067.02.1.1]RUW75542.1 type I secretion C-terminal target domain-containing protein [Mesorhizobium sp. M2A.F.Ca.ET.067.02.1.1]RWD76392.1 MAG: type I secretion C-terminal target domain-containing protein [Mesorhizobium sp.]